MPQTDLQRFYADHHDRIFEKRFHSEFKVRRRTHREIYESVLDHIPRDASVLDAGCGEGTLSILMAQQGAKVTGIDYSTPNIDAAKEYAKNLPSDEAPAFDTGDSANLPFADNSFDIVVSNHVLEHLPDFSQGVREIKRVTRKTAVIAVPTCINPCSWALLGGDTYWRISKRTLFGIPFGITRVLFAAITGAEGVNEGYAGRKDVVHVFRFPSVVRRILENEGFHVRQMHAQTIALPYFGPFLTKFGRRGLLRHCGFGTVYVVEKHG